MMRTRTTTEQVEVFAASPAFSGQSRSERLRHEALLSARLPRAPTISPKTYFFQDLLSRIRKIIKWEISTRGA